MHPYQIIRSSRRTLTLVVTEEGSLVVRAPLRMADAKIREFLDEKKRWIEKSVARAQARMETAPPPLSPAEEKKLREVARDAFIERACLYAARMGVEFRNIRLNAAKTRWGSCGPQGNLSFNWRLIQGPTEVLDYVVVHELAHLVERNHSRRFWAKVAEFCPSYLEARAWLKKNKL